jgi:hypothetical protein
MTSNGIEDGRRVPQSVSAFMNGVLASALDLEILMLLFRSGTFWGASAAATVLAAREEEVRSALARLRRHELVEEATTTEAFAYAQGSVHERSVHDLAEAYATRREDVLRELTGPRSHLAAFSDAFLISRRPR